MGIYSNGMSAAYPYLGGLAMLGGSKLFTPSGISTGGKFGGGGTVTRTKRKRKSPFFSGSVLKKTIRGMESVMHSIVNQAEFSTVHNTIYSINLTYNITQGTAQGNRQGDTVYLNALKSNIYFESPATSRQAQAYRVLIHWNDIFKNSGTWSSGTIGSGELFYTSTSTYRTTAGLIDPKSTYVIYDEMVTIQPTVEDTRSVATNEIRVQLNKAINYLPGTNEVNPKQLYMTIIPTIANGTNGTTDTGKFIVNSDLIFKNSK